MDAGHGSLLVTGRAVLCGAALDGVEDLVAGRGERGVQGPGEHRVLADAGQLEPGSGQRQRADLVGDLVAQAGAAGGEHAAGEHDERRVDHRDHGGDAQREPLGERGQQLVAGAGRGQRLGHGGLGRAGAQAEGAGQGQHRPAAGQLLEAARVAAPYVAHQRGAGERQEADLPGTSGGAPVDPAVDDDGRAQPFVRPQQDEVLDPRGQPRRASRRSRRGSRRCRRRAACRPPRRAARAVAGRASPAGAGRSGAAGSPGRRRRACRWRAGAAGTGRSRRRRRRRRAPAARGRPRPRRPCAVCSARTRRRCGR